MNSVKLLQIGEEDLSLIYEVHGSVKYKYVPKLVEGFKKPFDVVIVSKKLDAVEVNILADISKAYCVFYTEDTVISDRMKKLFERKRAAVITNDNLAEFLRLEVRDYFTKSYGEKCKMTQIAVGEGFSGNVKWTGNYRVELEGYFGDEMRQIAYWRNNIPIFKEQAIDFWLEYDKEGDVEIGLKITQFVSGTVSCMQNEWYFTEDELGEVVTISNEKENGPVFISLFAKGEGRLYIRALHDRHSRRGKGAFIPGGERYVTSEREEIFAYFDPGDLKPPLNVYFSGYKTQQGFEGYNMLRRLGAPFLLITEPRLEGGAFYMGSDEYEDMMRNIIQKYIDELGFKNKDVIFSGLSMGTYGALYYGCDINPHALIIGKPLASIGNVAENEKLSRPGGFPTSIDVLGFNQRGTSPSAVYRLNRRFWDKFEASDWKNTKFVVSYMIEDDYDMDAYKRILSAIKSEGTGIYGKGIHGRHNDNTAAIVAWFLEQYKDVLEKDFGRRNLR